MRYLLLFALVVLGLVACQREAQFDTDADETIFVRSEGASMPVWVKGNTASKTFILIVHGGPGGEAILSYSGEDSRSLRERYAVAFWDQRHSGASQGNGKTLSVAQFGEDLEKVVKVLKHRYGTDISIFLYGHSWGGAVVPAFLSRGNNQNEVKGWISIAGAHNYAMNDTSARWMLLREGEYRLSIGQETEFWQEVVDYCRTNDPVGNFEASATINGFAHEAEGRIPEVFNPPGTAGFPAGPSSLMSVTMNQFTIGLARDFQNETLDINFSPLIPSLQLPILALWGRYDFVVPYTLGEELVREAGSSYKRLVLFDHSGHSPMMNETAAFNAEVIDFVERFR